MGFPARRLRLGRGSAPCLPPAWPAPDGRQPWDGATDTKAVILAFCRKGGDAVPRPRPIACHFAPVPREDQSQRHQLHLGRRWEGGEPAGPWLKMRARPPRQVAPSSSPLQPCPSVSSSWKPRCSRR